MNLRKTQKRVKRVRSLRAASYAHVKKLTLRKEMVMRTTMMKKKMKTGTGMMRWEDSRSATMLLVDAIHRYVEGYSVSLEGAQELMGLT